MKLAATIGIPVSEFWEMTLDELNLYAEMYFDKQEKEFKQKLSLEYWNAMWTIQWLGRKSQHPRPLDEILDSLYKEKEMMTDEQMFEQVKALNKMFGGEEIIITS
jgi:hypothetical protein